MQLLSVERIWDARPHNAFPDLVRYRDCWWCCLREGDTHVSGDGAIRILQSSDGRHWRSAALLQSAHSDLRDPKFSLTPDGELRIYAAEVLHERRTHSHQSLCWRSGDGRNWGDAQVIADPNQWLWRVSWQGGRAYGIAYSCQGPQVRARLYVSDDGLQFSSLVPELMTQGSPSESAIVFDRGHARCLLRRDGEPASALLGTARAPYTRWHWQDLGVRIGGPQLLRWADGRYLAGVRLYDGAIRTAVCELDIDTACLIEKLSLPSGGDCSYPGMVEHAGLLWFCYYSSHEANTAIYLARIKVNHD